MIVSRIEDCGVDRAIGNDGNDESKPHAGVEVPQMVLLCSRMVNKESRVD